MDSSLFKSLEGLSREERKQLFDDSKSKALCCDDLSSVNGGTGASDQNPNSEECPYAGNWVSSPGYICDGEVVCL